MIQWCHETVGSIACTICGSPADKELVLTVPNPHPYSEWLQLYRCTQCASCFYHPIQLPPYAVESSAATELSTKFYCELGAGIDSMMDPLVRVAHLNVERTMLDVGCGFGFNLDFARRILNWDGRGVEPSPYGRAGKAALGVPIYDNYLQDIQELKGRTFGLVYSSEVIEHVERPDEFLHLLRSYVSPDGVLVLTTPNAQWVNPRTTLPTLLAILSPGYHLNLLSEHGLAELLLKAGFRTVETVSREQSLVVIAGFKPFSARHRRGELRLQYMRYLNELWKMAPSTDVLRDGVNYRLLKEYVTAGQYTHANTVLRKWGSELHRKYDFDVFDPAEAVSRVLSCSSFEKLGVGVPLSISGIYSYMGILYLNWMRDSSVAAQFFKAGFEMASHMLRLAPQYFAEAESQMWRMKYHEGLSFLQSGQEGLAIQSLRSICEQNKTTISVTALPDETVIVDSLYELGAAHHRGHRYEEARECFRQVIEKESSSSHKKRTREAASLLRDVEGAIAVAHGASAVTTQLRVLIGKVSGVWRYAGWVGIAKSALRKIIGTGITRWALLGPRKTRDFASWCQVFLGNLWDGGKDRIRSRTLDAEKMTLRKIDGALSLGSQPKLCVFSHFDAGNLVDDHVIHLLHAIHRLGCETIFVSTAEALDDKGVDAVKPYCSKVIVRQNYGRDFGSYHAGLSQAGDLTRWNQLILANDSVYGPLHDLGKAFDIMNGKRLDVWGITDSWEGSYHVQGYFMVFNSKVIPHLREFWDRYRYLSNKELMIREHEIGLSQWVIQHGYAIGALCGYRELEDYVIRARGSMRIVEQTLKGPVNSSHFFWKELVKVFQCPFLKIELLRDNPSDIGGLESWMGVVRATEAYDPNLIMEHLRRIARRTVDRTEEMKGNMINPKLDLAQLAASFASADPFPHVVIENFLIPEVAERLAATFPDPEADFWYVYSNPLERKLACNRPEFIPKPIMETLQYLNSDFCLRFWSKVTSIPELLSDQDLHGGGIHCIKQGGKLDMHLDYSIHPTLQLERRLNLIVYLNKDWDEAFGGELELWDHSMSRCVQKIPPTFNRAVIFATGDYSFHGHPEPLQCPEGMVRKSLAVYYLTEPRPGIVKRYRAQYVARPQDPKTPEIEALRRQRAGLTTADSVYRTDDNEGRKAAA